MPQKAAISGPWWRAAEILVDVHHTGRASSRVSPGPHPDPKRSLANPQAGLREGGWPRYQAAPQPHRSIFSNASLRWCLVQLYRSSRRSLHNYRESLSLLQCPSFNRRPEKRPPTYPCGHPRVARSRVVGSEPICPARFTALQLHTPARPQCTMQGYWRWADDDADEATRLNWSLLWADSCF